MELLRRKRDHSAEASDPSALLTGPAPATQMVQPPKTRRNRTLKLIGLLLLAVLVAGMVGAGLLLVGKWWHPKKEGDETIKSGTAVKLVASQPPAVELQPATIRSLGIATEEARKAEWLRPMRLYGQLAPNVDRLIRIKPRFAGQVSKIMAAQEYDKKQGKSVPRPIRVGDKVQKDDVLAVIWSKDLGQAKSDLVDSLSQLRLDKDALEMQEKYGGSSIPVLSLMSARRKVDADQILVDRAERTLRMWEIPDKEIQALKDEANRGGNPGKSQWANWAKYEIKAPFDGIIMEKNGTKGENIDPSTGPPLFQIADVSRLTVYAYPFEEDLAILERLGRHIEWSIVPRANPQAVFTGTVDVILPNVDPNQKTLILQGSVDNPDERLRSGMSVTVTIKVPAPSDEVEIPTTALVDEGNGSAIFVQPDPDKPRYVLRYVDVVRRYADRVFVRSKPSPEEERRADHEDRPKPQPLKAGQRVLVSGAVELKAELDDILTESAKDKE
ncbi:MAG TPA: efflux RND transporter periplasmic adaptor subunit [Gemmataceae bacterium]|jgi:cobalt-zinc-cadmium efflux system membrane fusion protein|nr:efflux RND transporter periplasmic adaptor subunit [Gemmataceae bacterium]